MAFLFYSRKKRVVPIDKYTKEELKQNKSMLSRGRQLVVIKRNKLS